MTVDSENNTNLSAAFYSFIPLVDCIHRSYEYFNFIDYYRVSQNICSTFDKILKNKDNVNKLMER